MAETRKVAILGSGPAGLTAAIYAARASLEPVVFEGPEPGGQLTLTSTVENYPGFAEGVLGPDLMATMREQAKRFGAEIRAEWVTDLDLSKRPFTVTTDDSSLQAQTLIFATGASAKLIGLASEKALMGRGVSTCATCDGFFFREKTVAVVGGGDTALEDALYLTKHAKTVTLIHRRDELRGSRIMQDRALAHPKIRPVWNTVVEDILDVASAKVTGLKLRDVKSGALSELAVDGLFVGIGHEPNTKLLQGKLPLDDKGYLVAKPGSTATDIPGFFAAGDVSDSRYRQAVTAAGSGCMAAIDVEHFLHAHPV